MCAATRWACGRSTAPRPAVTATWPGLLVERGADVNARHEQGHTPLHAAAQHGDADLVEVLLARRRGQGCPPRRRSDRRRRRPRGRPCEPSPIGSAGPSPGRLTGRPPRRTSGVVLPYRGMVTSVCVNIRCVRRARPARGPRKRMPASLAEAHGSGSGRAIKRRVAIGFFALYGSLSAVLFRPRTRDPDPLRCRRRGGDRAGCGQSSASA